MVRKEKWEDIVEYLTSRKEGRGEGGGRGERRVRGECTQEQNSPGGCGEDTELGAADL